MLVLLTHMKSILIYPTSAKRQIEVSKDIKSMLRSHWFFKPCAGNKLYGERANRLALNLHRESTVQDYSKDAL